MKKILYSVSLILLSLVLVACKDGNKGKIPEVNENDRVELTATEASDLFSKIQIDNLITKVSFDLNANGKSNGEDVSLETTATVYADTKGNLTADLSLKMEMDSKPSEGSLMLYVVNEDKKVYFDVDAKINTELFIPLGGETTIKGKYFLPFEMNEFDEFLPIPVDFDFESILSQLKDQDFINELLKHKGLTFYQKNNEYRIKLVINKELIIESKKKFGNDLSNIFDIENIDEIDFTIVVVIKDNKLVEAGAALTIKDVDITQNNIINITGNIHVVFGAKMPKLPDFSNYEEFDIEGF